MRWWKKALLGVLALIVFFALGWYGWHRDKYPYGRTHCCTIALGFDLREYALAHEGKFPCGEATPEASLSLLYRSGHMPAECLAGRAKSAATAKSILESGRLLGPDSCDWHYVEGLTWDDDDDIAILWDKSSLGHQGQRLHGGHEVLLLSGVPRTIRAKEWDEFLADQAQRLARRSKWAKEGQPVLTARVQMPDGTVTDNITAGADLSWEATDNSGGISGDCPSRLCWYRPHAENSAVKYRLAFNGLRSKPLTVQWRDSLPDCSTIVFRMY